MKHRARLVPRTQPRLLRAELEQTAPATQGTVGTPAQEHAQYAQQVSGNLLSVMLISRTAARASTGWEQEDAVKHRARYVPRA